MTDIKTKDKTECCTHKNVSENPGTFLFKNKIMPGMMRNCKDCKKFLDMLPHYEYRMKYHPDQPVIKLSKVNEK